MQCSLASIAADCSSGFSCILAGAAKTLCRGQHVNGRVRSRPCHQELMYMFFDPLSHGSDLTLQSQVIHLVFITHEQWWGSTQCKVDNMAVLIQTVPACLTIQSELSGVPQFQCFLQHVMPTVPCLGSPGNKLDG